MSLAKIPFVVGLLIGQQATYVSPTPPALEIERQRVTEKEGVLQPTRFFPYTKTLLWAAAFIETAIVIMSNAKWLPASSRILKMLMIDGKTEPLYLTPLSALGGLLSVLGAWIRFSCHREMGRQFTFDLSIRDDHKLITRGVYGVVRHPSYSGGFLFSIGVLCFYGSRGSWLRESGILNFLVGRIFVLMSLALLFEPLTALRNRMRIEDEALKKQFGEDWDEWAKKVPYWLIPGLY